MVVAKKRYQPWMLLALTFRRTARQTKRTLHANCEPHVRHGVLILRSVSSRLRWNAIRSPAAPEGRSARAVERSQRSAWASLQRMRSERGSCLGPRNVVGGMQVAWVSRCVACARWVALGSSVGMDLNCDQRLSEYLLSQRSKMGGGEGVGESV